MSSLTEILESITSNVNIDKLGGGGQFRQLPNTQKI